MKLFSTILFVIFSSCIPYVPPATPKYLDKIQVKLENEMQGDFYVQYLSGNTWQNVLILRNVKVGTHYDTIPFVAGLYRIITIGDSTNIFSVK